MIWEKATWGRIIIWPHVALLHSLNGVSHFDYQMDTVRVDASKYFEGQKCKMLLLNKRSDKVIIQREDKVFVEILSYIFFKLLMKG